MFEDGRALFVQIAESIEASIVDGSLPEDSRAPSTNELAAFHRINPATAAKGVSMLVDKGVLTKRRGVGMFVAPGARARLLAERRERFAQSYISPLMAEAAVIGLDAAAVIALIQAHPDPPTDPTAASIPDPTTASGAAAAPAAGTDITT